MPYKVWSWQRRRKWLAATDLVGMVAESLPDPMAAPSRLERLWCRVEEEQGIAKEAQARADRARQRVEAAWVEYLRVYAQEEV